MNVIRNVLKYFDLYFVQAQIGTEWWYNMPLPHKKCQFLVNNFIEICKYALSQWQKVVLKLSQLNMMVLGH